MKGILKFLLRKEVKYIGYIFILPQLLLFLVFRIYPIIEGIRLSLYRSTYTGEIFVGMENYIQIFEDPVFIKAISNTLLFVVSIVTLTIIFAMFVATTVFDKNAKYVSFIRGTYYLPVMVSMVVMSMIWNFLLNPSSGLITYLLSLIGIQNFNVIGNEKTVMWAIIFVTFVGNIGQAIILYIASMIGIPRDYFEAASIDGASRFQVIKKILIPLVRPTTLYLTVTNTIGVLKIFIVIQLLTGGGPNNASVTMMFYLYQNAFVYNNIGVATAIGVLLFAFAVLLSIPQFKRYKREW